MDAVTESRAISEQEITKHIGRLVAELQEAYDAEHAERCPSLEPDTITADTRRKFVVIDIGTSGAYMVERATGELFNIKGYGVPDRNKKRKADLGNVTTANGAELLKRRYNYLR